MLITNSNTDSLLWVGELLRGISHQYPKTDSLCGALLSVLNWIGFKGYLLLLYKLQ